MQKKVYSVKFSFEFWIQLHIAVQKMKNYHSMQTFHKKVNFFFKFLLVFKSIRQYKIKTRDGRYLYEG